MQGQNQSIGQHFEHLPINMPKTSLVHHPSQSLPSGDASVSGGEISLSSSSDSNFIKSLKNSYQQYTIRRFSQSSSSLDKFMDSLGFTA